MPASTVQTPAGPIDILAAARNNDAFRRVLVTGDHEQVVVMCIPPGGDIGDEVHATTDQLFLFVTGRGEIVIDGQRRAIGPDALVFVHAGSRHDILADESSPLRLITVYAPPAHAPDTVHETRADADAAEH